MTQFDVEKAMEAVKLFEQRVKAYAERCRRESTDAYGCAESAALRRASMELTKALARMRR